MLRAATVRARVNTISTPDNSKAIQPVECPISFPPINLSRVITPHNNPLVLTLCINNFDVHRVPVDPGSAVDLLQLPTFRQMKVPLDKLNSTGRILSRFNGATMLTMGDITLPFNMGPLSRPDPFWWIRTKSGMPCYQSITQNQIFLGHAELLTGYKKISISEHYRYGPAGLLIGVTHQYNRSRY